jgi:predicted ribosomally synthesized peptide with SipW-like signal peptide
MKKAKKIKTLVLALVLLVGIVGVGSTVALMTASDSIVNTFKAIEKIDTSIEETVDPDNVQTETDILKQPYVKNNTGTPAVIRARITVSPSDLDVTLKTGTWTGKTFQENEIVYAPGTGFKEAGNGWLYASDGWYYYNTVTAGGTSYENTTALFDAVYLGKDVTEDDEIDIEVYQESVSAGAHAAGEVLDLAAIQALFEN